METVGTERLKGGLIDRLTHHVSIPNVSILKIDGDSYQFAESKA